MVRVDPESGKVRRIVPPGAGEPRGIAPDERGRIYVSDGRTHTVKVFDAAGWPVRTVGRPGGP